MKPGLSLTELAREIERQENSKEDYIVPTDKMAMRVRLADHRPVMQIENGDAMEFPVGPIAHEQLATHYEIPRRYYDRMLESSPELLVRNVNHWVQKTDEKRFIRTLDGNMRAFLSDKYRPLDNYLIAKAAMPTLGEMANDNSLGLQIVSAQITERRLYIQCVTPRITEEVKVGDEVQMGITITNSEVGCGSVRVEPLIWRLACLNGMVRTHSLKRHHVGKRLGTNDVLDYNDFYASETVEADNQAFLLKVRDTVRNAFDVLKFREEVELLQLAAENRIETKKIETAVEKVTKKFVGYLSRSDEDDILRHLIEGGDLTQWGLANAVTSCAHDAKDQDKAYDYERVGGKIIDLSPSEWRSLAGRN
jgi:hypothetical protein